LRRAASAARRSAWRIAHGAAPRKPSLRGTSGGGAMLDFRALASAVTDLRPAAGGATDLRPAAGGATDLRPAAGGATDLRAAGGTTDFLDAGGGGATDTRDGPAFAGDLSLFLGMGRGSWIRRFERISS